MSETEGELIKEATSKLILDDIILYECNFSRLRQPHSEEKEAFQQHKRGAKYFVNEVEEENTRLVQFLVSLGTRVVNENEAEEPDVYFSIEADYIVEYKIQGELSEEALKAFGDFNAIHNVWPFWRQHVFDIVQKARLPKLDVPLFAGAVL